MSLTDCDHYCARCGEHKTRCNLCADMPPAVVYRPQLSSRGDDAELRAQERSIRRAADIRQGWFPV